MALSKMTITGLAVIVAIGMTSAAPALAQNDTDSELASASLADGETAKAIQLIEAQLKQYPGDPALLINLGIAHAQSGNDEEALTQFKAALASRDVVELDTADGRTTNSRRLARQAIAMLERGEFRPAASDADRLTLRN